VLFPEGFTRAQMARRADAASPAITALGYLSATASSPLPGQFAGDGKARNLEGFLFPATYDLFETDGSKILVRKQLDAFRLNWGKVKLGYARSKNLTGYDVLIIASMIEKEVIVPKERALVAAVIYNRLHQQMPLGIDATLRYGLKIPPTQAITKQDIASNSPYNTRKFRGLPPTPIANPGLASIQAAAHPKRSKYLFYVVKPCGNGRHAFSATDAQVPARRAPLQRRAREARRQVADGLLTTLAGVLGFPVAHSRSPAMMNAAFAELGLDWRYLKLPVTPEGFAATAAALPGSGYAGANVTIPHKEAALRLASERGEEAAAIGAANVLSFAPRLDPRGQHRRRRAPRRAGGGPRGARRAWCWAPGAPGGPRCGRCARRAPR